MIFAIGAVAHVFCFPKRTAKADVNTCHSVVMLSHNRIVSATSYDLATFRTDCFAPTIWSVSNQPNMELEVGLSLRCPRKSQSMSEDATDVAVEDKLELDDDLSSVQPTRVETHTVVSALVLICAVAADAVTAKDIPFGAADSPSSLRVTSLVLVAMMASPSIKGIHIVDQRCVLATIVFLSAFFGLHQASALTRTADCIFSVVVLLMTVQIYTAGGIEASDVRPDSVHDKPHRRQTVCGLCAALLFYAGARGIRDTFYSGWVASEYVVQYQVPSLTEIVGPGYAHATTAATMPLGFGYGIVVSIGLFVALHGEAHLVGSHAVAFQAGVSGVAVCVSGLWSLCGLGSTMESLPILYGPGACAANEDICYEAARARRLIIVNGSSAALWLCGLACLVFSFAIEKRFFKDKPDAHEIRRAAMSFNYSLYLCAAAVLGVALNTNLNESQSYTELVTIASLVGIFLSFVSSTVAGTLVYATAMSYEQFMLINNYGHVPVFVHLTHCTLFVMLFLVWVHSIVAVLKDCFLLRWFDVDDSSVLNKLLGYSATIGTSLAFYLYIASAILIATSNGQLPQEEHETFRDGSSQRTMIAFALGHFMPLFVWIPLYAFRYEVNLLSRSSRTLAWLAAVPLQLVLYLVVLASMQKPAPTVSIVNTPQASVLLCAATLAWVAAAYM